MPEIKEKREMPFKMGADPEFLIFYGSKILDASKIIKYFLGKNENRTLQPNAMGFQIEPHGELGWDGHNLTGEIRPNPEKNIDKLTEHIGQLLQTLSQKIPFADLTTLSLGSPSGGHIHVDITDRKEFSENSKTMAQTAKTLATFLIPLIATDHRISAANRIKGNGYGQADDIRIGKPNETTTTLEIRGQSAEWLTTQKITRSTLAYIGVIWNEILKNPKLSKNAIIFKSKPQINAIQDTVMANYKPITDNIVSQIGKTVKTFELYPDFKEEIDFILNTEAVMAEKEKNGWNINRGWNFNKTKNPTKRDLISSHKVRKILENVDMELIDTSLSINYNDDRYVSNFANAISERIAAFGWRLKNNYFLFGLVKGENAFLAAMTDDLSKNSRAGEVANDLLVYLTPTTRNVSQIKNILLNMWQKIRYNSSAHKINPQTGKLISPNQNTILIGIPYEIREKNQVKDLINLIWKIETGKLIKKKIKDFHLPQTETRTDNEEIKHAIITSSKEPVLTRAAVDIINQEARDTTGTATFTFNRDSSDEDFD